MATGWRSWWRSVVVESVTIEAVTVESKSVTKLKNKLGRVPTEQEIAKYEAKQEKKRRKSEEALRFPGAPLRRVPRR